MLAVTVGCTLPRRCAEGDLQAPSPVAPANGAIVDTLSPTLDWSYDSASPAACHPSGYTISVSDAADYGEYHVEHNTDGATTAWTPDVPLAPGHAYYWYVWATNGEWIGPAWVDDADFYTGPVCDPGALVRPVALSPSGPANLWLTFLRWNYPLGCLPGGWHVQLASDPSFAAPMIDRSYETWDVGFPVGNEGRTPLVDCDTYYWHVSAHDPTGANETSYSDTLSFTMHVGVCSPLPVLPPAIVTIPVTPLLVTLPAVPVVPMFAAGQNANCRFGPSQDHEPLTSILMGQSFPVEGINEEGTWYYIHLPGNARCWVSQVTGTFSGDKSLIRVIRDLPPLPKPKPVYGACHEYPSMATCAADPAGIGGCLWDDKAKACKP